MTPSRQDAWNQDEDLLLAEVVLRHIREGSTQLAAFEEVGKKLSRTSAACGFRWNSYVRKQYIPAIEIAKEQRKGKNSKDETTENEGEDKINKKEKLEVVEDEDKTNMDEEQKLLSFKSVVSYLENMQHTIERNEKVIQENIQLKESLETISNKNKKLEDELKSYKEKCQLIEEDYKALIEIMERARKMVVLNEGDEDQQMRFQMDKNGNLERVKK